MTKIEACPGCGRGPSSPDRYCPGCLSRLQVADALAGHGPRGPWHPNWTEISGLVGAGLIMVALAAWLLGAVAAFEERSCLRRDPADACAAGTAAPPPWEPSRASQLQEMLQDPLFQSPAASEGPPD